VKVRRSILAAVFAATSALVPVALNAVPGAQAAPGGISCDLRGFVLKDPTALGSDPNSSAIEGSGYFGAAKVASVLVDSQVTCTGTISGTANVRGEFVWCPQSTDHDPNTNPSTAWRAANHNHATYAEAQDHVTSPPHTHAAPTQFNCNGAGGDGTPDEAAYPGHAEVGGNCAPFVQNEACEHPTNVHVVGSGDLLGDSWLNTLSQTNAPDCAFTFEGHALAPPRLDVVMTCGTLGTWTGSAEASFVPVIGQAGDVFGSSDPGNYPEKKTCAVWMAEMGPEHPDCFRAVIFDGNITAAATA
jgi:hypothetical protein